MNKKRDWVSLLLSGAIISTPVLVVVLAFFSGNRRLEKVQTSIRAGMTTEELTEALGKPIKVVGRGEPLTGEPGTYKLPLLDEHTEVHVYGRASVPYYRVYVFVDKRRNTVLRSEIENLWW